MYGRTIWTPSLKSTPVVVEPPDTVKIKSPEPSCITSYEMVTVDSPPILPDDIPEMSPAAPE